MRACEGKGLGEAEDQHTLTIINKVPEGPPDPPPPPDRSAQQLNIPPSIESKGEKVRG